MLVYKYDEAFLHNLRVTFKLNQMVLLLGFKHKFSYDKRWRDAHRYRTYFTAMLMAQTLPGENASKQLEIMIEPRDRAKQASIYRYFLAWKKSPDGMAVARMYANV